MYSLSVTSSRCVLCTLRFFHGRVGRAYVPLVAILEAKGKEDA